MKSRFSIIIALLILIMACKKGSNTDVGNQWIAGTNPSSTEISQWMVSNAPPVKTFTYPKASGYYAMSDSIAAYFPPLNFVKISGADYSGNVTIKM